MIEHSIPQPSSGRRLDAVVRELAGLSQKQARRLCAVGAVAVNGVRREGTTRVRIDDVVRLDDQLATWSLRLGLPVVYADDHVLVLHKLPGVAVHGGPLVDVSVADALREVLPQSGLAHRLDRDASGLLLVGATPGFVDGMAVFTLSQACHNTATHLVARDEEEGLREHAKRKVGGELERAHRQQERLHQQGQDPETLP